MTGTRRGGMKLSTVQIATIRTDGMVVGYIYPQVQSAIVFVEPGRFGTPYGRALGITEQDLARLEDGGLIPDVLLYESTKLTEDTVDIVGPEEVNA